MPYNASGKLAVADKAATSPYNDGFKFLSGGGGLVSTLDDYGKFCEMLVQQGSLNGKQIIKPATLTLMFTDQLQGVAGGFKFGLGFAIRDIKLGQGKTAKTATQYSWGGYASTDFRIVPTAKMYQVMLRQRVASSHNLANELFGSSTRATIPRQINRPKATK